MRLHENTPLKGVYVWTPVAQLKILFKKKEQCLYINLGC